MIDPARLERQLEIEDDMGCRGAARYRSALEKARARGKESDTDPGLVLLKRVVDPLALAITTWLDEANSGQVGRRMIAAKLLDGMDPHLVAFITARICINCIAGAQSLARAAIRVASHVEDEARFVVFQQEQPILYKHITDKFDAWSTEPYRRKVLANAMNRVGIPFDRWSQADKLHLGMKLIDLFNDTTGILEKCLVTPSKNKKMYHLVPTDQIKDWISKREDAAALFRPVWVPTIIPPKEWSGLRGGGYYSETRRGLNLIKRPHKLHVKMAHEADLSTTYRGVNALQNSAFSINLPVLDVLKQAWDNELTIGDLPEREDVELPPKPLDMATNDEARKKWRQEASIVHDQNTRSRSSRAAVMRTLSSAEEFKDEPEIFFPYELDFRGRAYCVPQSLNPQGPDYARALLRFSKGKALASMEAVKWLAVHGSNCFGFDKASLEDRFQWTLDHDDEIMRVAQDPWDCKFWIDADKPWSFLAFCFEWAGYRVQGLDFVSRIPIAMDGTCNGLQHFSAMLRDPIGGSAVNLVPSDKPQDIYQRVADRVIEKLRADTENWHAQTWLAIGIDRKVTKRPVMTLPYGATLFSCRKYVEQAYKEKTAGENPFGDQEKEAVTYLSQLVWSSIGDVVVAARSAMDWLQKTARVMGKAGLPLSWVTPSGFPVVQAYQEMKQRRVKCALGASLIYMNLREPCEKIDAPRQVTGISPNFVHSMDASAMILTIDLALDHGVDQFAMIHDSYGTTAADTETLAHCLRSAFVSMYQHHDVLTEFRETCLAALPEEKRELIPELPTKGVLDLEQVRNSPFFFS